MRNEEEDADNILGRIFKEADSEITEEEVLATNNNLNVVTWQNEENYTPEEGEVEENEEFESLAKKMKTRNLIHSALKEEVMLLKKNQMLEWKRKIL